MKYQIKYANFVIFHVIRVMEELLINVLPVVLENFYIIINVFKIALLHTVIFFQ